MSLARPLARQTKTPARTLGLMVAVICEAKQTASQRRREPQARRCSSGRRFTLRKSNHAAKFIAGNKRGRPWLACLRTNPKPKLNDYRRIPEPPPVRPPICLPISPTSRKTPVPSCSRLLTLPRPLTRLRERPLFRTTQGKRTRPKTSCAARTCASERRSIRF